MNLRIPHPRMMTMMVMMMVVEKKNMRRSQKIERLTVIVLNGQSRSRRRRRTSQASISLDQFLMSVKADVPVVLFHLFSKLLLCGVHFLLSHPTRVIRL